MSFRAIKTSKAGIAAVIVALALVGCGGGDSAGVPTTGGQQGQQGQVGEAVQFGSAALSWNAPSTRVNGSRLDPVMDVAGYIVRYGQNPDELEYAESVSCSVLECGVDIDGLTEGTWHFAVHTVDKDGLMSELSEPVSKSI